MLQVVSETGERCPEIESALSAYIEACYWEQEGICSPFVLLQAGARLHCVVQEWVEAHPRPESSEESLEKDEQIVQLLV